MELRAEILEKALDRACKYITLINTPSKLLNLSKECF